MRGRSRCFRQKPLRPFLVSPEVKDQKMKRQITALLGAALLFGATIPATALTVDFEDLSTNFGDAGVQVYTGTGGGIYYLAKPPEPVPEQSYDGTFSSSGVLFSNQYTLSWGYDSWGGFSYSTTRDLVNQFPNQYSAYTTVDPDGTPAQGLNTYAVAYDTTFGEFGYGSAPQITLPSGFGTPVSLNLANTTWAALYILDGYTEGDYLTLTISGLGATGELMSSIDIVLADYRNGQSYLLEGWQTVGLTGLGSNISSLKFTFDTSDPGTPLYAAIDNLVLVPEPSSAFLVLGGLAFGSFRRRRTQTAVQ